MFSTDRITAELRLEEYKKIAESYSHLAEKEEEKEPRTKKSIFTRFLTRRTA